MADDAKDDKAGDVTTYTQDQLDTKMAERDASEAGLKANRDELLGELKALQDKHKAFDGIDPEEHKALIEAKADAVKKKAEDEGDWQARENQLVELHGKETDTLKAELVETKSTIEKLLVDSVAVAAIAEAKGSSKVLLPHVKQHVKVAQKDGEYTVHVVDANGVQRFSDGNGTAMTITNLVAEMREDAEFARNFEGSGSSGGGSAKSTGGASGGITYIDKSEVANYQDGLIDGTVRVEGWASTT